MKNFCLDSKIRTKPTFALNCLQMRRREWFFHSLLPILKYKEFKDLKVISAGQAEFLRKKYPEVYVTEICRQKKSKRKKYFVEETDFALRVLKEYEGV